MCTGDAQFLRIYSTDTNTRLVDGYGGYGSSACAPCARVDNFRPSNFDRSGCKTYTIREGCFGEGKCSATVKLYISNSSIPSNFSHSSIISNPSSASVLLSVPRIATKYLSNWNSLWTEEGVLDEEESRDIEHIEIELYGNPIVPENHETDFPLQSIRRRLDTTAVDDNEYEGYCGYRRVLHAGVIAGIAIGTTIGAIAFISGVFLCMRWKQKHDQLVVPAGYHPSVHVTAKDEWVAEEKF
jgi:hypothetical protein